MEARVLAWQVSVEKDMKALLVVAVLQAMRDLEVTNKPFCSFINPFPRQKAHNPV